MKAIGYNGWTTVEILPYPNPDEAARRAVEFIKGNYGMKVCGVESHKELLSLFLSFLDSLMYVPQEQEDGGVKVYRWTDCSTMDAPHMLYLAMDWNSTQLVDRPLSCLPDSINKEERQEEDLTDGNLMLASTGGAILSYHAELHQFRKT